MSGISAIGGAGFSGATKDVGAAMAGDEAQASGGAPNIDLEMLKKSQDLAKDQNAQLLAALPKAPSPPGVGGKLDIMA